MYHKKVSHANQVMALSMTKITSVQLSFLLLLAVTHTYYLYPQPETLWNKYSISI